MKKVILIFLVLGVSVFANDINSLYKQALSAFNEKQYERSSKLLKEAYEMDSAATSVIYLYGLSEFYTERHEHSIQLLNSLPESFPVYPKVWYIAASYKGIGRYDKAYKALVNALKKDDPKREWKHYVFEQYITLLNETTNYVALRSVQQRALSYLEGVKHKDIEFSRYNIVSCSLNYCNRMLANEKVRQAEEAYQNALKIFKDGIGKYEKYADLAYPLSLFNKLGLYQKSADLAQRLPEKHRPFAKAYYQSEAYEGLGRTNNAMLLLEKAVLEDSGNESWRPHVYMLFAKLIQSQKDGDRLLRYESSILPYFQKAKHKHEDWVKYLFARGYFESAKKKLSRSLENNSLAEAQIFLERALKIYNKGLGEYEKYLLRDDIQTYKNAAAYSKRSNPQNKPGKRLKVLILVCTNVDAIWTNDDGKKMVEKHRLKPDELKNTKAEMRLFHMLIYYLSDGNINISYSFKMLPGTLRGIEYSKWTSSALDENGEPIETISRHAPILNSTKPHIGETFKKELPNLDTFIFLYPSSTNVVTASGGRAIPPLDANGAQGRISGMILSPVRSALAKVLVHEFFHIVESTYYDKYNFVLHVFRDGYEDLRPSYYSGNGELSYYKETFENVIKPLGYGKLFFSQNSPGDTVAPKHPGEAAEMSRPVSNLPFCAFRVFRGYCLSRLSWFVNHLLVV